VFAKILYVQFTPPLLNLDINRPNISNFQSIDNRFNSMDTQFMTLDEQIEVVQNQIFELQYSKED